MRRLRTFSGASQGLEIGLPTSTRVFVERSSTFRAYKGGMAANIDEWLRGLGLEQYASAFHDNDIDVDILSELTTEDLTGIGVASIGHRRRLLAAIAALRERPSSPSRNAPVEAPTPSFPADLPSAERRLLTILFCDLVGSTEIATRLDPEDLRELIATYHRTVADALTRFGGFVAKYMGDGILAYFGYPRAQEEDAERAVRAGLAIVDAVGGLDLKVGLAVRLGIATGLVVVGDLIGAGAAQEQSVIGETPNLAARLQALAGADEIVIADATRRHIGGLFELRDLGSRELKGFAGTTQAWQVLGESGVTSRFEALRSRASPLIGRDEELDLLLRRWTQAKQGEGRVVLLSAEPGIGKSRLTEALAERFGSEPHVRLRYFCSPHHQDSALYPIIGQLEHAAGFARDDTPSRKAEKLAALIGADDDRALLADLLSLPSVGDMLARLTPLQKKDRIFDALLRQMGGLAQQQPLLMVFEDVHWIDPTTLELLDRIIARVEHLPVLLLATFRPEFQPSWVGQPHVTMLALSRLARRDGTTLVQRLAGNLSGLPDDIVNEIIERTDGVPLFLEEVTKAILEAAQAANTDAARGTVARIPGARTAVPATLQASLMARLDRLGPVTREIAQTGAVIGRDFTYGLVIAVAFRDEAQTRDALDRLVAAGLVFQRGTPPNAEYQYKHALVQDTAYGTMLRGPRQALHGRAAAAIERLMPERIEREPELLAYHLAEAGETERAAGFWRRAGELAVRRAANREAIGHFRRALALIEQQPQGEERHRAELAVLSQLAPPLMSVYGWAAPEAGTVVERAAELGRRLPSSAEIAPAIANLWIYNSARGRFDRAAEISTDLFRIARELDDSEILLQAHHCAWATRFFHGEFKASAEHIEGGVAIYDRERHAHHRHVYLGHDPRVCSLNFGASVKFALGYPDQAYRLALEGVALARELDHAPSLGNALWRACEAFAFCGDDDAVKEAASELIALTDVHGLPMPRAHALNFMGWALTRSGRAAEGLPHMLEMQQALSRMGSLVHATMALGFRAKALVLAGQFAEGLAQIERTILIATDGGEQAYLAWQHRIRAEALLHVRGGTDPQVEASLKQALDVARGQDAKGWEIGAATDLARLWAENGRRAEAYDLLAPVYGWFTEGFETTDLKDAKALLTTLS